MALRGAIAWFRVAEFASRSVWTAVVMDINEIEADDPRAGAEDHRRLLDKKVVDESFEFGRRDRVQLSERVVVGVGSTSGISNGFDRLLIDSSLQERLTDDPGVEAAAFDSRIRISASRSSAKVSRSAAVRTVSGW